MTDTEHTASGSNEGVFTGSDVARLTRYGIVLKRCATSSPYLSRGKARARIANAKMIVCWK